MKASKQNQLLKYILIGCAAVILVLSVVLCVTASKNKALKNSGSAVSEALVSAAQERESLEAARASEAESYQNQLNEQSAAFADEKNALNQTIADLNKQIAIKRAAEAAAKTTNPSVKPTPPVNPGSGKDLSQKTIYLTFDDGPSPRTPEVLKILRDNGVKATFFVTARSKNSSHYMKDIVAEGHTIALHTYTHDYAKVYASEEAYFSDLQQISDLVYSETGVRTNLIRFPGGSSNTVSKKYCPGIMTNLTRQVVDKGYVYFDWNITSGDADKGGSSAQAIINNCRKVPQSNAVIVLMHDSVEKRTTVEALPEVIAYYKAAGCKFAALDASVPPAHQRVAN